MTSLFLLSATLILVAATRMWGGPPAIAHVATVCGSSRRAASGAQMAWPPFLAPLLAGATRLPDSAGRRPARGSRSRPHDPLRHHRAVVGREARTPWYARVRSVMVLILIIAALGAALSGLTLLLIASGRILLETLAG